MRSSVIARLIILGSIAILSTLFIQFYIIRQQQNVEERAFRDKAITALSKVAKRLSKNDDLESFTSLIKHPQSNYFLVNINDHINVNTLDYYLKVEFQNVGLKENYEFGIYDCDRDSMVYHNAVSYEANQKNIRPGTKLPTYKDYLYYFGVRFPDRQANPFYSYTWVSLGLLMLILLFFAYSLWIILKQRTLAEMQKDFINNLTHEFKTPLAAVNISSDVLLQNEVIQENPRLRQYAQIIKNQNQLLNTQVERVLQVARMEKTNFQILPEPVNIHEIITDLVSGTEPRIKAKNGEIHVQLNAMAPVISADRIHFIHIIQNVLDNAIKYSEDHQLKIELETYDEADKMVIRCADHGSGIPKEYLKKIFSRFYRVPTGNVHNVKGFGLGLHYVYQICKAHGWKIRIESQVGVGTSLYIEIPKVIS
ncbi:MAG TPA: HAMP domain-containing sensor histidine kinase [Saprospiraceae bacterium]|nr:HAMP domain-containing sensor histidine kinase [Saprospiraceae bacterium]HNT18839.1 HAMP domain-containing sensor histidine kinase [Saprospiraceae bacterium]